MLTDTQRAALAPFAGMLDTMTDEALAAAAEVPVEAAAAFRAGGATPEQAPAEATGDAPKAKRGKKADVAPAEAVAASVAELVPVEVEPCPKWVKVVRAVVVPTWPRLRRRPVYGDLYTDADAELLWTRHRDAVAPVE